MNLRFGIQESMMPSSDRPAGPFVATFSTQRAPAAAAVMLLNEEMMMETGQAEVAANNIQLKVFVASCCFFDAARNVNRSSRNPC